jgi:hypothetical protein
MIECSCPNCAKIIQIENVSVDVGKSTSFVSTKIIEYACKFCNDQRIAFYRSLAIGVKGSVSDAGILKCPTCLKIAEKPAMVMTLNDKSEKDKTIWPTL